MICISEKPGEFHIVSVNPSKIDTDIILSLYDITRELGHFPMVTELKNCKYTNLFSLLQTHGGISYFRKLMGYEDNYRSALSSYIKRRGKNTEDFVMEILQKYSKQKNLSEPTLNYKFDNNKRLEFVCEYGNKIGIDVTNTRNAASIKEKYIKRDYHIYLDKLFIVVFSDNISELDYVKLNELSPDNVYIISIEDFCVLIQYELNSIETNKINKYKSCIFNMNINHNRIDRLIYMIKRHGNNGEISHSTLLRCGHFRSSELKKSIEQGILEKTIKKFSKKKREQWYSLI